MIDTVHVKINERTLPIRVIRDDLYPSLGGGNKGRKMDYIGAEIKSGNFNAIVTTGGIQSNHCRAVAVYAARMNLVCVLVLHGNASGFENLTGNAKIMRESGARLVFCNPDKIGSEMDKAMNDLHSGGYRPFYLYGGGHTLTGGQAYIDAFNQFFSAENAPDYIFLASGTGSTQGGIMAAVDMNNLATKVVGISVGRKKERAEQLLNEFYNALCQKNNILPRQEALVLDNYLCGGYGKANDAIISLSSSSIEKYGFALDATYTAKAFYGMLDYLNKNNIFGNIVFWHTGGIFNYMVPLT